MPQRSFRRGGALLVLPALLFFLAVPAQALFDHEDRLADQAPAPIAENLSLTTYRNVAVRGTLAAVDPEGGPVTFQVTKNPARGALTFDQEGGAQFTYTPYEDKLGKDSFEYVAIDSQGDRSQTALVSIRISKADTKVTYSDLEGHPAQKAAIRLAEEKLFVGEQMGGTWFFRPDAPVTREEFLSLAMDLVEMDTLPQATRTGFADDASISVWAKPYVASAYRSGMVRGTVTETGGLAFGPDRAITCSEAAVMLSRLLGVTDVAASGQTAAETAPVWAYQSVVNLAAVGVIETTDTMEGTLTRGQAVELLLSALDMLEFRAEHR